MVTLKAVLHQVQKLWKYLIIVFVLLSIRFIWGAVYLRKTFRENGYEVKPFSHLYYMLVSIVLIYILKEAGLALLTPIVDRRIEQVWSPDMWAEKKLKTPMNMVNLIWYSISSAIGIYLCWNSPAIPTMFLGSQPLGYTMRMYPGTEEIPYMPFYYMFQMGSRTYSLINSLIRERKRPDFHEMMLHHLATLFAMLYSYFTNTHMIGVIILLIHDWGDWSYRVAYFWRDLLPNHNPLFVSIIGLYCFNFVRCIQQPIWFISVYINGVWQNPDVHKDPNFYKFFGEGEIFYACIF